MKINETTEGMDAWITFVDGKPFDGPHRKVSTNKANLTKYIKNTGNLPNIEDTFIQKFIIKRKPIKYEYYFGGKSSTYYLSFTNTIYVLTKKDKKKYIITSFKDE